MAIHRSMIARMSQYHRPHPTSSSSSSYAWYSNSNNNNHNNNHNSNTATATTTTTTTTVNTARLGMTLNLPMLHSFLLTTVPQYSSDRMWIDAAVTQYQHIVTKMTRLTPPQPRQQLGTSSVSSSVSTSTSSNRSTRTHHHRRSSSSSSSALDSHCREELLNCVTIITTFISTVRQLPPLIIFEAHFLLGCIHATLLQYTLAHHSWVKALWMATANSSVTDAVVPTEWLALTLYCLGRNYSDMGQSVLATKLLSNAEQYYTIALRVPRDHVVLVATRKLLTQQQQPQPQRIHEMTTTTTTMILPKTIKSRRKQQQKGDLWSSSPSLGVRHFPGTPLFLIPEEEPTVGVGVSSRMVGVGVSSRMIPTTTTTPPPYRRSSL
jgi:hypothetical protein